MTNRELTAAECRQLEAEADAYEAQAAHDLQHALCNRRIADLKIALRNLLAQCQRLREQHDEACEYEPGACIAEQQSPAETAAYAELNRPGR